MASIPTFQDQFTVSEGFLNSVSEGLVPLISSNSRVYLPKDCDPVGLSVSRSVGFSKWAVVIGRTGFGTISSIPDPTLSLMHDGGLMTWRAL